MPGHVQRHSAVSCAKMAEPIDLPFGLWLEWAQGSTSSIVFAVLRQCARMGVAAMRPYVKLLRRLVITTIIIIVVVVISC